MNYTPAAIVRMNHDLGGVLFVDCDGISIGTAPEDWRHIGGGMKQIAVFGRKITAAPSAKHAYGVIVADVECL